MELDWSEQSAHIRTLYAAWQPGDGYEESIISGEELRLGVRLPAPLRSFYRAWGRRKDMTQTDIPLLGPAEWILRPEALIFCVENQATMYWAILSEDLEKANPPVVKAYALREWEVSEIASPLTWMLNYSHVSDFLDMLTYHHALCGGALHGGWSASTFQHEESQDMWLEQHWQRTTIAPMVIGLVDEYVGYLPFYVRPGQALFRGGGGCWAATSSVEDLDEIGQVFQVTWRHRW
jgi:hypothetical protein